MERREQYDPEDIEGLLSERTFDELLAEEKAFVLRHMSGRDEYERMRAMLHYIRPEEGSHMEIEADGRVRTNVLAAFKAQQQPQWRIWLNSISVWLAPREAHAYWRPALAFATLALLIVAGVFSVRQFEQANSAGELAELERPESVEELKKITPSVGTTESEPTVTAETSKEVGTSTTLEEKREVAQDAIRTEVTSNYSSDLSKDQNAVEMMPPTMSDMTDDEVAEDTKMLKEVDIAARTDRQAPAAATGAVRESHQVTEAELAQNMSLANISVVSKASKGKVALDAVKFAKEKGKSRSMAEDSALLGLVTAGW